MASDWVKVFSTELIYLGELVKGILEEENITSFLLNKKDSTHTHLFNGEVEIYVQPNDVIRAKRVLEKRELWQTFKKEP